MIPQTYSMLLRNAIALAQGRRKRFLDSEDPELWAELFSSATENLTVFDRGWVHGLSDCLEGKQCKHRTTEQIDYESGYYAGFHSERDIIE